jgi:hypothetical protein
MIVRTALFTCCVSFWPLVSPATTVVSLEATAPTVSLLRAVRGDELTAPEIANTIRACLTLDGDIKEDCLSRAAAVLRVFSQCGPTQRNAVLEALKDLEAAGTAPAGLQALRAEVEPGPKPVGHALSNTGRRASATYYAEAAHGQGPPTRRDIGVLRHDLFDARLFTFVGGLLGANREARVKGAFEAASASNCDQILKGKGEEVCRDLGLWTFKRACLRVALFDLYDYEGDDSVVSSYLAISPEVTRQVIEISRTSDDRFLSSCATVLERWLQRRPTRWQAWADVQEVLAPQP